MKVIILQNILSSNNVHTINTLIPKLGLKRTQVKVLFCSNTESNRRWSLQEKPLFDYQVLPNASFKLQGKDLFTYFINSSIFNALSKESPDRIIVGGWDQFAYQTAMLWGKINGKQITIWSGSTANEPSWRRLVAFPLVRLLVWISDDFIAYGSRAKQYLLSLGAKGKIVIHKNDVNREFFRIEAKKLQPKRKLLKKKFGISKNKNFLYVGQLIERKGIWDLLNAYHEFSTLNKEWGLVLVGYGQLKDSIKQYLQVEGIEAVVLIDSIEQYELPAIYVTCDCLILPSHEEVWGLVVNEAVACGLPAIVSDVCGCVPELSTERKITVFKSKDVEELKTAMVNMSKNVI